MYAWRIIYGIGVEIGVRDVLIFDEYKKRNGECKIFCVNLLD